MQYVANTVSPPVNPQSTIANNIASPLSVPTIDNNITPRLPVPAFGSRSRQIQTLGTTNRTSIPWNTPGVEKLAVQTVMAMKIWDPNMQQQLKGNLMRTYRDGVHMFVASLKRTFLVNLSKDPSWQTIQNRVVKVLMKHRTFRNKQRATTGGGERKFVHCNKNDSGSLFI